MIRRGAFHFTIAISLLLCAGTVWLWVRSHFRQDSFVLAHTRWALVLESNYGQLMFERLPTFGPDEALGEGWSADAGPADRADLPAMPLGFGRGISVVSDSQGNHLGQFHSYWFPHWALALLFGVLPGCWIVGRIRRRGTARPGHCSQCGYDLRASKDKCPECGKAVSDQPKVTA